MTSPQVTFVPAVEWKFAACAGLLREITAALSSDEPEGPLLDRLLYVRQYFEAADGAGAFAFAAPELSWDERRRDGETMYSLDLIDVSEDLIGLYDRLGRRCISLACYILWQLLMYYAAQRFNIFSEMLAAADRSSSEWVEAQKLQARMLTLRTQCSRVSADRANELQTAMSADLESFMARNAEELQCGVDIYRFLAEFNRMRKLYDRAAAIAKT